MKNRGKRKEYFGYAVLACLLFFVFGLSEAEAKSRPLSAVTVRGERILLGDILVDAPAPASILDVGPAPKLGKTRKIFRRRIVRMMRRAGLSAADYRLPLFFRVSRAVQTVSASISMSQRRLFG